MKTIKTFLTILTITVLSVTASAQAKKTATPASTAVALKGGKVMTITKGTIENGVVVMENGKITAVGAAGAVTIPKGAKVIDVTGMTVYPGLIDSHTRLGLTEISAVDMTNDTQEPSDPITPQIRVADAFHAESELIPVTRLNGITNAIVSPTNRNTLPGQLSFIQLDGKDRDEMLMVQDLALPLNFNGRQRRNESFANSKFPATRMGVAAQLRQALIDAQDYQQKWADFDKKSAEWEKKPEAERKDKPTPPKRDLKFESLVPYLQGKKPVVLTADTTSDVKVALEMAHEFNLKVILSGVMQAQSMFDEIAATKLPVVLGEIYDTPKPNQRYDAEYSVPAELAKRGVKIAFASYDSHQVRNLPYAAGYAVAFGLPYDEAMKALTINPAEIWGVADKLGSLEVGKMANVVVANGDPLELKTDVKMVFINGHEVPMVSKQTQLRDAYMQR
ncbi:MAG: amidohydrolase family protein [Acidobacteriales bacterium]|nr:amidohydrolase family protein [Terriglobales bacterium]